MASYQKIKTVIRYELVAPELKRNHLLREKMQVNGKVKRLGKSGKPLTTSWADNSTQYQILCFHR